MPFRNAYCRVGQAHCAHKGAVGRAEHLAVTRDLTVVTRDTGHFSWLGFRY